jgi:FkbM family methyltransferase
VIDAVAFAPADGPVDARLGLVDELLAEILRDAYRYVPAVEPRRPTLNSTAPSLRRGALRMAHRGRNVLERSLARAGLSRRHYDAALSDAALRRILELRAGFETTAALLGDAASRRAVLDVLKLRVLGPYHAPLPVTPDRFRAMQAYVDRTMMRRHGTFAVADPWFSPISLYEVPARGGSRISLHAHSVDIVSVFLLDQYSYRGEAGAVAAREGDVVLDVGGCWGDTALYFADLVGPTGRVFTFEFDPQNLEILGTNLALNPELARRIEVVDKALWDVSGETLQFALGGRTTTLFAAGREATFAARTVTLDDFVAGAGPDRVDFVKMDVEGAEGRVLAGARNTLERDAPALALAAYHRDDDLVQLPAALAAGGPDYRCFVRTASPLEEETVLFAAAPR